MKRGQEILSLCYYSNVVARDVRWLWYPYIPLGKISVLLGDPGDGKTTFALDIAARLSRGLAMPESDGVAELSKVIYQSAEDGAEDTLKPRLVSAGADCSMIAFIEESEAGLALNDQRIEKAIIETSARLLVIDPLQAYIGEGGEMNRADGIRPLMKHIGEVADRTGCAILIIGHMNKSSGTKGVYRALGSIDIIASARSVLLVGRTSLNPSVRVMAQLKNSLAPEGAPIAFEINENAAVRWIGKYDVTVEEILNGEETTHDTKKMSKAIVILEDLLSECEQPCAFVYESLHDHGIGKRTADKAKKLLAVKSTKKPDGWYWSLSEESK